MWTKLTHLVKHRGEGATDGTSESTLESNNDAFIVPTNTSSVAHTYDIPPNPFASDLRNIGNSTTSCASPPASPSKASKRSIFRRSLKAKIASNPIQQDANSMNKNTSEVEASPFILAPKKKRASLQLDTFLAQSSLSPAPHKSDSTIPPHTPTMDLSKPKDVFDPNVEVQPSGTGSIRSILRDKNTPGTGRSVRFFSRDAYRVISPDVSEVDMENIPPNLNSEEFMGKLRQGNQEPNHSQLGGNSTTYHSAFMSPQSNIDDMVFPPNTNQESRKPPPFQPCYPPRPHNLSLASSHSSHSRTDSLSFTSLASPSSTSLIIPTLPADMSNLMDNPGSEIPASVEGSLQDHSVKEEVKHEGRHSSRHPDGSMNTIRHNSGSRTVTSTPNSRTGPARTIFSPEGIVFHPTISPNERSFTQETPPQHSKTAFFTPDTSKTANDTAFFTPGHDRPSTLILPSPRKTAILKPNMPEDIETYSHEELLYHVREQLSLQQQLVSQFEIDLGARDELVSILSTKLQTSETSVEKYRKELEKRQVSMRALRHKVADLEKLCRGLEEEVERSREESFERSVMDEASEGALVVLHGSIGQLKGELEKAKEENLTTSQERDKMKEDMEMLQVELQTLKEREETRVAELEKVTSENQIIPEKEAEIKMLREELEVQWHNTEKADEKIKSLEGEKEGLAKSVQTLDAKVEELGAQWKDTDARRAELEEELNEACTIKEEIIQERDQLVDDVNFEREHAEQLTQSLEARESRIQELEQEQQYATDNISRLEGLLRNRDSEIAETHTQIVQREQEAEELRAQISRIKWEHNRLMEEQTRNQNEFTQQEEIVRSQLQAAVKQRAEGDVKIGSIQEQLGLLNDEVERLRRQVHDLQQESADKEVKIVQLMKARTQDKEDKEGLNIALDSKQQELELLKRKLGVKGTAGSTPAPARIGLQDTNTRRHSLAFVTPSIRPKTGSIAAIPKSLVPETPETVVKSKAAVPRSSTSTAKAARIVPPSRTTPLPVSSSTLTRSTSSLARSTRTRTGAPVSSGTQRSPSVMSSSAASYIESEKENVVIGTSVRQRSMVPA